MPTRCPEGREIDRGKEQCKLKECTGGRVRAPNAPERCCYPGQVWSKTRAVCVGVPQGCPAGFEVEGETCASSDRDGDGVPNRADACPEVAEDRDGFQDADGCPDADNDADGIPDAIDACRDAAEDKNGHRDEDGCPDGEEKTKLDEAAAAEIARKQADEDARKKAEDEARRRDEEKAAAEKAAADKRARWEAAKAEASDWRGTGVTIALGGGIAGAVVLATFAGIGAAANSEIQHGEHATAGDLEATAKAGKVSNGIAIVAGVAAAISVGAGVTIVLLNGDPKEDDVARAAPEVGRRAARDRWARDRTPRAAASAGRAIVLTVSPAFAGLRGAF